MLVLVVGVLAGLAAGLLTGGRLQGLEHLALRRPWLVLLAIALQLVAFSGLSDELGDGAVVLVHLASYELLLVFAALNIDRAGLVVAGAGLALNALVITVNFGFMPASEGALAMAGQTYEGPAMNNSAVADATTRLAFLGDVLAVPQWVPFANVFSVGDVLIAVGCAWLLAAALRAPALSPRRA